MEKFNEILNALEQSKLILRDEVMLKIKDEEWNFSSINTEKTISCRELHRTYSIRCQGLDRRSNLYAIQFHKSTSEFLSNLKKNLGHSCFISTLASNVEYTYFIAFEPTKKNILGLMKIYKPEDMR